MSAFDISTASGLAGFLNMQASALSGLHLAQAGDTFRPVIADLVTNARRDLHTLGSPTPRSAAMPDSGFHPVAVDYIVGGSQLGAAVLKQRWASSGDPVVLAARSYFSAPPHTDLWREFTSRLGAMPADGAVANRIVEDARRLFLFFTDALPALNSSKAGEHGQA
ncbi:MAG: hypothetical protein JJ899_00645 [Alphaproteobacteria bacterium]|nr:hypothetical protein [Alphaproteobacteria bacterium]